VAGDLSDGLAKVLALELGPVSVVGLTRLSAGANRETWSFDAVASSGERHQLVLQRQRPGSTIHTGGCADEAVVLRRARGGGVPVPEVVMAGDPPNPLESSYMVVRRLEGETIARRILRDDRWARARAGLVADCAGALAAIHRLDPAPVADRLRSVDDSVALHRDLYDGLADPHPVLEMAFRWLDRDRPAVRPARVVHGDFRLGNLLVDEDGLVAALDWELCHLGDPVEDLGWLCGRAWRFGAPLPVAGIAERQELLDAYRSAGGDEITLDELRWWEVLGTVRWGITCMYMTNDHRRGGNRSVELATIGRRVAETEYDVLLLLPEVV
jgi:aminoglycoside phosphotransferase (APT) family kinase protein